MTTISLLVAYTENRVIGLGGGMPWHLPADLKHFKALTMGKPMVMGRRTYESIGRPLPGRRSIVLTRAGHHGFQQGGSQDLKQRGSQSAIGDLMFATSLDEALAQAAGAAEVVIIGGGEIYREALPRADRVYATEIHARLDGDTFFPQLDAGDWRETARQHRAADAANPYDMSFVTYERRR